MHFSIPSPRGSALPGGTALLGGSAPQNGSALPDGSALPGQLWPGCQGGFVLVLSVLLAEPVSVDKPRVLLSPLIRWEVRRG